MAFEMKGFEPFTKRCWKGYRAVPGKKPYSKGSCKKISPLSKQTGGGTKKVCLPLAKIKSMSKSERNKVINAKRKAGSKGKYKRSSKSFIKDGSTKSNSLEHWVKQDWRQVGNPKKKCGEK